MEPLQQAFNKLERFGVTSLTFHSSYKHSFQYHAEWPGVSVQLSLGGDSGSIYKEEFPAQLDFADAIERKWLIQFGTINDGGKCYEYEPESESWKLK